MPTVKLNKQTIHKLIGKKLSDEQLKDRISYLGTDLESVDKEEISVEVFPNRPDLLSEQGFARALASFVGAKKGLRNYAVKKSTFKVIIEPSVKHVRPYTACALVKGLKLNDELIREIIALQEKLHVTYGRNRKKAAIGIYPLEHITPPVRFLARKPKDIVFAPLELNKELTASQILSMHPTGRAYGHLLEGHDTYPIFIDAKNNILSLPPVINSNRTGKVTSKTRDVFVECSGFDFEYLQTCLNMVVTALADMGGDIYSVELKYDKKTIVSPNLAPKEMKIDLGKVNTLLGLSLTESDLKGLLEKMGFGYKTKVALVPAYRADILHEVDLIEDIAIAYGYDHFTETFPTSNTVGRPDPSTTKEQGIRQVLIGHGLLEACNVHLSNDRVQLRQVRDTGTVVRIKNGLSEEFSVLRKALLPGLLETLQRNKVNEYPQNFFEIGTVFAQDKNEETGIHESQHVGIALCHKSADFTKIRQIVDALLQAMNIAYEVREFSHPAFIEGRSCEFVANGKSICIAGEIAPEVLELFGLEMPVASAELNIF